MARNLDQRRIEQYPEHTCYRRRGHNEADNPSFTQPQMYDIIDNKRSVRKLYTEALVGRGDITLEDAEAALKDFQAQLEKVFVETRNTTGKAAAAARGRLPPEARGLTSRRWSQTVLHGFA